MEENINEKIELNTKVQEKTKVQISLKSLIIIFITWIFLWIFQNYLLFWIDKSWISFQIFIIIYLLSLVLICRRVKIKLDLKIYLIILSIVAFSIFKAIRIGDFISWLNNFAIIFLNLFLITIIIKRKIENIKLSDYFIWYIRLIVSPIFWIFLWLKQFLELKLNIKKIIDWKYINVVKWVFMTIPILYIFISLFASSDLIFWNFVKNFFDLSFLFNFDVNIRIINIIFFSIIFIWFFSFLIITHFEFEKETEKEIVFDNKKHIEINIMLTSIVLLFITFVFLQINYLFAWEQAILSQWYTYAEYAKSWFYELIIIAIIVFILLWKIDDYLYSHKKVSESKTYKILSSMLIILTIIILLSAFYRLYLYENAYWFTETRFYSYVFIITLWLSLIVILIRIYEFIKEWHFIFSIFSLYLLSLFICNIINPESLITIHNLNKQYIWTQRTDFSYIERRSADAIDNMLKSYDSSKGKDKISLKKELCSMLEDINENKANWKEFNFANYYAHNKLLKYEKWLNCKNDKFISDPKNTFEMQKYLNKYWRDEVFTYYEWNRLSEEKKYEEAISKYKESISINPSFERSYLNLWNRYNDIWNNELSIEEYKNWLKVCEDRCWELYENLWDRYFNLREFNIAIGYYEKALIELPDKKSTKLYYWASFYWLWNTKKAIIILKEIDSDYSSSSDLMDEVYLYLWMSYFNEGDSKNALDYLTKSNELVPLEWYFLEVYNDLKL